MKPANQARPGWFLLTVSHPSGDLVERMQDGQDSALSYALRRRCRKPFDVACCYFFGYTLRAAKLQKEATEAMSLGFEAARVAEQEEDREPHMDQPAAQRLKRKLASKYSSDPVGKSHGETFLEMPQDRLEPQGLYFLDEPEAPMSPTRVIALLSLIMDLAKAGSQFVVATHSPILMALPKAEILLLEGNAIKPVAFDEVEHVSVTRAFLNDPSRFLRHL